MMWSMLNAEGLDKSLWPDAIMYAVFLKNRFSYSALDTMHFKEFIKKRPDISHLLVFGSRVIVKDKETHNGKLDENVIHGIFL